MVKVASEEKNAIGGMFGGEPKDDDTGVIIMRLRGRGRDALGGRGLKRGRRGKR